MGFLLFLGLPVLFPYLTPIVTDPAPGLFHSKSEAQRLDCRTLGTVEGHDAHPGKVVAAPARLNLTDVGTLECGTRLMEPQERMPRDEAILSELRALTSELAEAASASVPGKQNTWLVEAYYPDTTVTAKIAFATKTELVSRGHVVSDRVPMLAAGDILVLGTMAAEKAYPLACRRYFDEGSLSDTDILLGVMLLDTRETLLHAGICSQGVWRWLR